MGTYALICRRWEDNVGLIGNLEVRPDISNVVKKKKSIYRTVRFIGCET